MRYLAFGIGVVIGYLCWRFALSNPNHFMWVWALVGSIVAGWGLSKIFKE